MHRLAVLYDIHGNLVALEAVLAEAEAARVDGYLLGGDYATFGPWPRETVERLDEVPAVHRLRGNVERWLVEPPEVPDEARALVEAAVAAARAELGDERDRSAVRAAGASRVGRHAFLPRVAAVGYRQLRPGRNKPGKSVCSPASATVLSSSATATCSSAGSVRTAPSF